jgi:hypothetical protein
MPSLLASACAGASLARASDMDPEVAPSSDTPGDRVQAAAESSKLQVRDERD